MSNQRNVHLSHFECGQPMLGLKARICVLCCFSQDFLNYLIYPSEFPYFSLPDLASSEI